jgi:fucose permease
VAKSIHWRLIALGFLFLVFSAYIDNLRGILLPVFSDVFSLSHQQNSTFLVLGNFASVLFTLSLLFLTRRLTDKTICIGLCVTGILTLIYAHWVTGFASLLILSILFGGLISLFGSMANLNVIRGSTLQDRAKFFCGLHTMYGLGSLCAPEVAKRLLAGGYSWSYTVLAILPLAVLLLFGTFGMPRHAIETKPVKKAGSIHKMQILILGIFAIYVAGEVMTSMWMASYLVESVHLTVVDAAPYLSGFFLIMAITRILCFFSMKPQLEIFILIFSLVGAIVFFGVGYSGSIWAFPLVGLLGPFFPLFLARLGKTFPDSVRSLTLWILASNQLTQACFHFVVGGLADRLGIRTAYGLPFILLAGCFGLLLWYLRLVRNLEAREKIG